MSAPDPFALLIAPLNASGVPYMVTGAHAAAMFGEPRFTNDLDVVMRIGRGEARRLHAVFPEPDYYIAPVEIIEDEAARPRHGHFNVMHNESALRLDVYCEGDDALAREEFERKTVRTIRGQQVWFVSPEYLIVNKLRYVKLGAGTHHLRDIAGILRVSGERIDRALVGRLVLAHDLEQEWAQVPGVDS
jgi:hypothetical protein